MNERELSLAVVGIDYPNPDKAKSNRRFEIALCAPGDPVVLRREPRNKHDERAIAVFTKRQIQIGFLNAERAAWLSAKLDQGEICEAVFQQSAPTIAVIRLRFGGGAPTLPPLSPWPPTPAKRPEGDQSTDWDDFTPDPDAPTWGA